MRILAFSDIEKWGRYERLVHTIRPDVVALAGDLTSDGSASFARFLEYSDRRKGRRLHIDRFYKFLRYAGARSQVLVVKGDHDTDFEGAYIPEKINGICGCQEISGGVIEVNGIRFLGLGVNETSYLRILKPIIEQHKEEADVVITHCKQDRVPLVSLLKPRLIIRGHFGSGKYLVDGIPAVFTANVLYTVIDLEDKRIAKILQYSRIGFHGKIGILENGSCSPWFSGVSEYERYEWLRPYNI
ncbi:MAG: metallophosphoesterase [Dehalococcoidia bacterium]